MSGTALRETLKNATEEEFETIMGFNSPEIYELIKNRLNERFNGGMIAEVELLLAEGLSKERLKYFGLEYKIIGEYLSNKIEFNLMRDKLNYAINRFAKRQMTFFRRMEKRGIKINWINPDSLNEKEKLLKLL